MNKNGSSPNNLSKCELGAPRIPIVLCNAGYYGTVAAMRSLGRAGVPVVTVDTGTLSLGRMSRYSNLHLSSPPFDSADWSSWLLALGRNGPRRAIYATSDAVSFALADRREELTSVFDLYQPDIETMMCILDKGLLHKHALAVGMDMPETWFPQSADEAERIVRDVGGTIVAKPRSQLSVRTGAKGLMIDAAATNVRTVYDDLLQQVGHDNSFIKRFPEAAMPMLQKYYPGASESIYTLSGFRDVSGQNLVMRAALKILQRPRRLGIGLCFEEADVIPALAERTARLCERIGYYGAFELEFIVSDGRFLLIDFNGRFYNQMAFDIARGMDLPRLVYAGATGGAEEVARLASAVPRRDKAGSLVFCSGFSLSYTIAMQRVSGKMPSLEANRWREWRKTREGRLVDAVYDANDPMPAFVDVAEQVWKSIRYPGGFLREMVWRHGGIAMTLTSAAGAM